MAKKLSYERYYWFHGRIKAGAYPNAATLAERFELSRKQAQRDIEFIRDRLNAPLVYNPVRRGYEYGEAGYELPPVWLREDELVALCLASRLSAAIPDKNLKSFLRDLLEKFLAFRSVDMTPELKHLDQKVSVKNVEYYRVNEKVFHKAVTALFEDRPLKITYRSPHKDEETERTIQPLHLLCYMGNWHLIAFCTLRGELRDFALSRVHAIEPASARIDMPSGLPPVRDYIRRNFGVISGAASTEVILRFTPQVSSWVSEQVWHDAQEGRQGEDGSLHLTFPVSGFEEVWREILRYGASVEVFAPEALRERLKNEIEKMNNIYR